MIALSVLVGTGFSPVSAAESRPRAAAISAIGWQFQPVQVCHAPLLSNYPTQAFPWASAPKQKYSPVKKTFGCFPRIPGCFTARGEQDLNGRHRSGNPNVCPRSFLSPLCSAKLQLLLGQLLWHRAQTHPPVPSPDPLWRLTPSPQGHRSQAKKTGWWNDLKCRDCPEQHLSSTGAGGGAELEWDRSVVLQRGW